MIKVVLPRGWWRLILLLLPAAVAWAITVTSTGSHAAEDQSSPAQAKAEPINTTDLAFVHKWLPPGQFLTPAQIKPGMAGYGLTVFQGTKIERFEVKVIGVVKKMLNGRDAILVRLAGGPMGRNNVIRGMSGSPVYIDGKLIGAISFGYDFSKEPIAGITPIVDMLDALAPEPVRKSRIAHRAQPMSSWVSQSLMRSDASSGAPRLVPLVSPITLAGFSPRAEEFLRDRFKPLGMLVSSGSGGALDSALAQKAKSVQPGASLSVLLTTGDFTTVTTGTATAMFGDRILAFGHPFLQAGSVDFPMATAYVHDILPNLFVSFKVASPVSVIGAINADRPWSVGGTLRKPAKMIPAEFTVTDTTRNVRKSFRCQVVDHPDLTPDLLAAMAMSAIDATHQSSGPYVALVRSRIEADGIEPLERADRFSSNLGTGGAKVLDKFQFVPDPVGAFLLRTTSQIVDNDFQKSSIKTVKLDITLQDGHETAELEKVYVDRPFASPGETVNVSCVLKPYDKEPVVEALSFKIPIDMPDGNMLIGVAGGDDINPMKKRMGIADPTPESLKQVAQKILDKPRGDALVLIGALPEQSLIVKGVKIVNPPAHWNRIFYSNRHTRGPALVKGDIRVSKTTAWMIEGSHILTVEVRSPEKVLARGAPYLVTPGGSEEGIVTTEQAKKAIEASRKAQSSSQSSQSSQEGQSSSSKSDTPSSQASKPASDYPHMRPPQLWRQDNESDFRDGKAEGVTIDSWGRLRPGFDELAQRYLPGTLQVWSGTWSRNYFWFATADKVWRWKGDASPPEQVAKFDSVAIPAMTSDSQGTIYAATLPGGQVWALDGISKPHQIFRSEEPIITSLCTDGNGNLFVGVANSGKVYKIDSQRHASVFFNSGQAHVLSLFFSASDGRLYVGTGEKGSVYRVDADGKAQAVYQSQDHLVTGVARDKKGDLYVATAGQGHLFRVLPSGEVQTLALSEAFYTLHYDPVSDAVFSGDAEGDITQAQIDPLSGQPYFLPVCHTEQEAVLALACDPGGKLYAATSNLGMVRAFAMRPASRAFYSSVVRDAGRPAVWSVVRLFGALNEPSPGLSADVQVETRTGQTARPDETWSAWQEAKFVEDAFAIASPPGRYLQYRLSWKAPSPQSLSAAAGEKRGPATIGRVDVSYLPNNSAPRFSTLTLKAGAALSGKQKETITASDADGDNLLLSVHLSADETKTWKLLATDLRPKRSVRPAGLSGDSEDGDKKGATTKESEETSKDEDKSAPDSPGKEPLKGGVQEDVEKKEPERSRSSRHNGSRHAPLQQAGEKEGDKEDKGQDQQGLKKEEDKEKSEKDKDKNKDKEKGTAATAQRRAAPAPGKVSTAEQTSGGTETFSWSWDTTKHKDGTYILKFVVDDRLSSPTGNLTGVAIRSVVVDNTPPQIELVESSRDTSGALSFKVRVADKSTAIANATYKLDDGEPFALANVSGNVDALSGTFGAASLKVAKGSHKVEVKATDKAGNSATKTFTVK